MTEAELIELIVTEFEFTVDAAQFYPDKYIIRRLSKKPYYKTEYTTMWVSGDVLKLHGRPEVNDKRDSRTIHIHLADPNCFIRLKELFDLPDFLFGSLAPLEVPIGNRVIE